MDTYTIKKAYPWLHTEFVEIEILSDNLQYLEVQDLSSGCRAKSQNNREKIHKKCKQIADLIREIEKLNYV